MLLVAHDPGVRLLERRAVRRGLARRLLLGSLVRVQVAGEVLVHEPRGIQVLDLERSELRAQSFAQRPRWRAHGVTLDDRASACDYGPFSVASRRA